MAAMIPRRFRAAASTALASLLLALPAAPPTAAQQAVWDPAEIARLSEKSAEMAEALSRAVELVNRVNDLSRTIGRTGALSHLDFTRLDVVEGLQGAGPEIGGLAANIGGVRGKKIASFKDAQTFVTMLTSVPAGQEKTTKVVEIARALDALHRQAAEDGYALAMHTRDGLTAAPARARLLVAEGQASGDLRGDAGANTAVNLAVLEQLTSLEALLASILEIETTRRLARGSTLPASK